MLPCYNEADNIPLLLEGYRAVWQDLPAELILVNNGSTDHTAEVLQREMQRPELAFVRTVLVPQNRGYGHGIHTGLEAARGKFIGFSHADMQCSPGDLFRAYHKLRRYPSPERVLIKGRRQQREPSAMLVTKVMGLLASTVLSMRLSDINAQPKVFHCSHFERFTSPPDGFQYDLYVLYKAHQAGLKTHTIPVVFGQRAHGESKWSFNFLSRYRTIWATILYIFRLRCGAGK